MREHTCPPEHAHGATPTCYRSHKCGCDECRQANTERCYARRKLIAYGRWQPALVDAQPVHEHLVELVDGIGMSTTAIAVAGHVDISTVRAILRGNKTTGRVPERIYSHTAARLLSVKPDPTALPDEVKLRSRGARRRVQALVARGWSVHELARQAGIPTARLDSALRWEKISAGVFRAVSDLYERLWDQEPPAETRAQRVGRTRALTTARLHGWLPPLAWDDIDTDEAPPQVEDTPTLDDFAIELALNGERVELTREERLEATRRGSERGMSARELAERFGVDPRTIERDRSEPARRAA